MVSHEEAIVRTILDKDKEACKSRRFRGRWTTLYLAAAYRDMLILQLLLEAADTSLRDDKIGRLALDIAASRVYYLTLGMDTIAE